MKRSIGGDRVAFSCVCTICRRVFRDRYNLSLHVRSMHGQSSVGQVGGGGENGRQNQRGLMDERAYGVRDVEVRSMDAQDLEGIIGEVVETVVSEANSRDQGLKYYLSMQVMFVKPIGNVETDPPPTFRSKVMVQMKGESSDAAEGNVTEAIEGIRRDVEEFTNQGSGWVYQSVENFKVYLFDYTAIRGGSYIPTPPSLRRKEAIVNVKNDDEYCFIWSITAALHPAESNVSRPSSYRKYVYELNRSRLTFPVHPKHDLKGFEDDNDLSINVYCYEDEVVVPTRISEKRAGRHVDLLIIMNDDFHHYTWLKNMSRLLYGRDGHMAHRARHYCHRCLGSCNSEEALRKHLTFCRNHYGQREEYPSKNEMLLKFEGFKKQTLLPFIIYADFECRLVHQDSDKYQRHVPISYCLVVKTLDDRWRFETETYTGDDCMEMFMNRMDWLNREIRKVFERLVPLSMTDFERKSHRDAIVCYCCSRPFSEDVEQRKKVRDHCHITGKYRGAACNRCNKDYLNIIASSHPIPIVFHNLTGYDMHHVMRSLGGRGVQVMATTSERIITANITSEESTHGIKYIDSLNFMSASLAELANNLPVDRLTSVKKFIAEKYPQLDQDVAFALLRRKGVYPYDWMDNLSKMDETSIPNEEAFYNELNDAHIGNEDYEHAKKVWNFFGCRRFKDYHELYLQTDVMLLADVFESFRQTSLEYYGLDPAWYISLPAMAWDAMLKKTNVVLELLTEGEKDIYLMVEEGIRGGITMCTRRLAESGDESSLIYLDANNLYGWAMSQPLPHGNFSIEYYEEEDDANRIVESALCNGDEEVGHIFKVDLDYPARLHDNHSDLPLAAERMTVQAEWLSDKQREIYNGVYGKRSFSFTQKLIPNLFKKVGYVLHERNLRQCLEMGLVVTRVYAIVTFNQSPWLREYIDFNTEKRARARNDFEKNFFKLMNNAVFGKTMENVRGHKKYYVCTDGKRLRRWVRMPQFYGVIEINEDTLIVERKLRTVLLKKPIYVGFSILEISKTLMYDFHYNYMRKQDEFKADLCYMDTDSFIYAIDKPLSTVHQIMKRSDQLFDFSNYPKDHPNHSTMNKKVIGKMKDEMEGKEMEEFVGLRAKVYSCKLKDGCEIKKAKGVKRGIVKNEINHADYKECLLKGKSCVHMQRNIVSQKQIVYSIRQTKLSLAPFDDKRYLLNDGITTLPYGHRLAVAT